MVAVVQINAESSLTEQSVNVWHWRIPEANSVTEVNVCINALDTFYTAIASHFTAQTFTIGARVVTVNLTPNRIIAGTVQTAASATATATGFQCAALLQLLTSTVGGSFRGRKYLGPLASGSLNANGTDIATATISAIQGAANTLVATSGSGVELGIWSRTNQVFTPCESAVCKTGIATQRRRLT
jgi:hypothetical protein